MKNITIALLGALACSAFAANETQKQPAAGSPAPEFSLASGSGGSVSLKDYRDKWVVLYFYPKDFTGGCTMEAKNFQRDLTKYRPGWSRNPRCKRSIPRNRTRISAPRKDLTSNSCADPDAKVSALYGSTMDYKGAKIWLARNAFFMIRRAGYCEGLCGRQANRTQR